MDNAKSVTRWIRFRDQSGTARFGTIEDQEIVVFTGDMFADPVPTDERVSLEGVEVLTPCLPSKLIALWNNLSEAAAKQGWEKPLEPLYFLKPSSSVIAHRASVKRPASYSGRVVYEGELGVIIGKACANVAIDDVDDVIFGYTCINDVTAVDLINEDASFAQWTRAKSFDTFAAIGPVVASGIEPQGLQVTTTVGGKLRQSYPVSDMFFSPRELVSLLSRDMTLFPGDVIACGTSTGVMPMRAEVPIEVQIEGIGVLSNSIDS